MKTKKMAIKEMRTMKMELKDMATKETRTKEISPNKRSEEIKRRGRLWAPQDCEIFPSIQWTSQAWTKVATRSIPLKALRLELRVLVSALIPIAAGSSNQFKRIARESRR